MSADASSTIARLFVISKFIAHPQYDSTINLNDIAVIRTKTEMEFNGAIGPICLPFRFTEKTFLSSMVTALGKFEANIMRKIIFFSIFYKKLVR